MNYIDEVLSDIKMWEAARTPRDSFLHVRSEEDLTSEALQKVESITFLHDYKGPDLGSVMPGVLYNAQKLKKLTFQFSDSTVDLRSLDLRRIENLSINTDANNCFTAGDMPALSDLSIHYDPDSAFPSHLDLTTAPKIKTLALYDTNELDLSCLNNLNLLKILYVRSRDMIDLDWLNGAGYNLNSLSVDSRINDCEGIINQPELERLSISNHVMLDVSPIENLKQLKKLDLLYGTLLSEGNLRAMGLEYIRLNKRDEDYRAIRAKVHELCSSTARMISYENRVGQGLEAPRNPYLHKMILRRIEKPLDQRIEECIAKNYDTTIKRIGEDKHFRAYTMNRAEYIDAFKKVASEEYPFLKRRQ